MKKLLTVLMAVCVACVFTLGCGETKKETKKGGEEKKGTAEKKVDDKAPEKTPDKK